MSRLFTPAAVLLWVVLVVGVLAAGTAVLRDTPAFRSLIAGKA